MASQSQSYFMPPRVNDPMVVSENYRIKAAEAMKSGDLAASIELLGQALNVRTSALGHAEDLHVECADLYYEYGKALLEESRRQNDFLGGRGTQGDDTAHESTSTSTSAPIPSISTDATAALASIIPGLADSIGIGGSDGASSSGGGQEQMGITVALTAALKKNISATAPDANTNADGRETDGEDEDDDDDLKLAWENLEAARLMYKKSGHDELLADVLYTLGEVSMEGNQFSSAARDLAECVSIRKRLLGGSDSVQDGMGKGKETQSQNDLKLKMKMKQSRKIAEACYMCGMAYQLDEDEANAVIEAHRYFVEAVDAMQSVVDAAGSGGMDVDEKENEELKNTLADLKAKVSETEAEAKAKGKGETAMTMAGMKPTFFSPPQQQPHKPTSFPSHSSTSTTPATAPSFTFKYDAASAAAASSTALQLKPRSTQNQNQSLAQSKGGSSSGDVATILPVKVKPKPKLNENEDVNGKKRQKLE